MAYKSILLIGGGGHCRSVLDVLLSTREYGKIGIIEQKKAEIKDLMGVSVVGNDDDLSRLFLEGWQYAFITLGSIGDTKRRQKIYQNLCEIGYSIPNIVDPTAIIGRNTCLNGGVFVGKRTIVNTESHIGTCAILNTACVVEHDCTIGDFAHIAPSALICGGVFVGKNTHIGAGACIRQQLKVGENTIIGMGSVVVSNIPSDCIAYGNPCRMVKTK